MHLKPERWLFKRHLLTHFLVLRHRTDMVRHISFFTSYKISAKHLPIFEKVLAPQISPFLNAVLFPHLSASRRCYYSECLKLLVLLKNWRKYLIIDKHKIGAFLMDLRRSTAFECIPQQLLK